MYLNQSYGWANDQAFAPLEYRCGHCGREVTSNRGYKMHLLSNPHSDMGGILICPGCGGPSFIERTAQASRMGKSQIPGVAFGQPVANVPPGIDALYEEARRSTSGGNYTAAVMLARKILMNIAVSNAAKTGQTFAYYVDYLQSQQMVPANAKPWVDHIRQKGNDANHDIEAMSQDDAKELLIFTEMLLKLVYEFPSRVPSKPAPKT